MDKMDLETKFENKVWELIDELPGKARSGLEQTFDLILWGHYIQDVLSQFGMGYQGVVFRQRGRSVVMTIKVLESGVPLVAFITAVTTMGCIEQMFGLLYAGRLRWQKDKYPWN